MLTTETIHLGSKGPWAKLQLELIVLWSKCEDVAEMMESDLIHDSTIDVDIHVLSHVRDRDQPPIHPHLPKEENDASVVTALRNAGISLCFFLKLLTVPNIRHSQPQCHPQTLILIGSFSKIKELCRSWWGNRLL